MGKSKIKSFFITKELDKWLKLLSFTEDRSQGKIIREALEEYRSKHSQTPFTNIKKQVQGK